MEKQDEILKTVKSTNKEVVKMAKVVGDAHKLQNDFVPLFNSMAQLPEVLKQHTEEQRKILLEGMDRMLLAHERLIAETLRAGTFPWVGKVLTLLVLAILLLVGAVAGVDKLSQLKGLL